MNVTGWLLTPLALAYTGVMRCRNAYYDRVSSAVQSAGVPVISVGNITVGGTGKTPMVIEVVRRLCAQGHRPAILTRGYKGEQPQTADEVLEFHDACPDVPVVVDADRVAGAATARQTHQVDCLVLDDGFQHRRLARDLDVVLVDALYPWGDGWTLPAGRLREPLSGLPRGDVFVITRANQAASPRVAHILADLSQSVGRKPILQAGVAAEALVTRDSERRAVDTLAGRRVLGVCGLGNPETFEQLLATTHAEPCGTVVFGDHQQYGPRQLARIRRAVQASHAEIVVTTRKDWVKLSNVWPADAPELLRLDVRLELLTSADLLDALLRQAVEKRV